jgi:hypothetical protein
MPCEPSLTVKHCAIEAGSSRKPTDFASENQRFSGEGSEVRKGSEEQGNIASLERAR